MRTQSVLLWCTAVVVTMTLGCGGGNGPGPDPDPDPNPGSNVDASSFAHNLQELNAERMARGLPLFTRDASLDAFAQNSTLQLMQDHIPHGYFQSNNPACSAPGFNTMCAENQGDPNGWTPGPVNTAITQIIDAMMNEEFLPDPCPCPPAADTRGHYKTIVNPSLTRVGIGLQVDGSGQLYLTNVFSN